MRTSITFHSENIVQLIDNTSKHVTGMYAFSHKYFKSAAEKIISKAKQRKNNFVALEETVVLCDNERTEVNLMRRKLLQLQLFTPLVLGLAVNNIAHNISMITRKDSYHRVIDRQEEIEQLKSIGQTNAVDLDRLLWLNKLVYTVITLLKLIGLMLFAIAFGLPFDFSWFEAGYVLI